MVIESLIRFKADKDCSIVAEINISEVRDEIAKYEECCFIGAVLVGLVVAYG